jgi:Tol biopolymer transport system component
MIVNILLIGWLLSPSTTGLYAPRNENGALDGRGGGIIAFYSEMRETHADAEIYVMNADGSAATNVTNNKAQDLAPDLSPDGSRIVFVSDRDGNDEIYSMNTDGSRLVRLTKTNDKEAYPFWSSDGRKIIYCAFLNGNWDVFMMNADGSGQTRITDTPGNEEWASLSPDSTRIAYATGRFPDYHIYLMNENGSQSRPLVSEAGCHAMPKWSRDGKTIACNSGLLDGGKFTGEIHLIDADGANDRKITDSGGECINENPYWSPDGKRIVFQSNRSGNFQIYVMEADGSHQIRLTNHQGNDYWPSWAAVHPDQKREEWIH